MEQPEERGEPETRRIAFEAAELTVLRKACARYRSSLPVYLHSGQPELRLIESILRKLS